MKTIGIFTGYFIPHLGGVERYVDKLSGALQHIGYRVVVVTTNDGSQKEYEEYDTRCVYRLPILKLFKERYPIPRKDESYARLTKAIHSEGIDYFIINTRFHLTSLIGARMANKTSKPCILIEHGTGHFSVGIKYLDFLGAIYEHVLSGVLKKYVAHYYGVSEKCIEWLRHFGIKGHGVFYNAIDKEDAKIADDRYKERYADNVTLITYAGRLIKEKGVINLIDAYQALIKKNPLMNVRLAIAGDGDLMHFLKEKYGDDESIDLLGKLDRKSMMSLYARTDVFAHPSQYPEGLPTSILEAGLMECAIVATPRGGTEEVIVDDKHGIIVEGSVDSLYKALYLYVNDKGLRQQAAVNVRKRVETIFDWTSVAKQVGEVVNRLSKDEKYAK
jgi:glycosyltransferase involved in cell wall biosynthesis